MQEYYTRRTIGKFLNAKKLSDELQNFYYLLERDRRLKIRHITLYFALLNTWNKCHFTPVFRISGNLLMHSSRIGSKNTFAITIQQLHQYGYIIYQQELHKGHYPKVTMIRLTDPEIVKSQLNLFPESMPTHIRKWQAAASKWLLTTKNKSSNEQPNPLHTKNNKNYSNPL